MPNKNVWGKQVQKEHTFSSVRLKSDQRINSSFPVASEILTDFNATYNRDRPASLIQTGLHF